jgi:phosphoesterase RecJ-like protein
MRWNRVKAEIAKARVAIEGATSIAIVSHIRPDGDAVGSLLALTIGLRSIAKHATPVLADGVPNRFKFLPGARDVQESLPSTWDLLIAIDCSDLERTGFSMEFMSKEPDINIDHHPTNTRFGSINLIDPQAAASAEILYHLFPELGIAIDIDMATNLLAGLVTDTIGFRTSNVTSGVLDVAARLVERGADLVEVYEQSLNKRTLDAVRYWGCGLSRLEQEDGIVWTSLTIDDRKRVGYPGTDDADLINLLSTIAGSEVTLIFVEQSDQKIKVSWRSRALLNVADLAATFGGGGHDRAAGAIIDGKMEEVQTKVLSATKAALEPVLEL